MSAELGIVSPDGVRHTATIFFPEAQKAPVVLFLPAMGAPAEYYRPFAEALAKEGGAVAVLLDLRGQGRSSASARNGDDFGYREIVEMDLPEAVAALGRTFQDRRLYVAGHSLGGQMALLASARGLKGVEGIALVGAGTAYWRDWLPHQRPVTWLFTHAVSAAARMTRWYPGRALRFGGEQPRQLMRDWSSVALRGRYELEGSSFDYEAALRTLQLPVLSIGVTGDVIAPRTARRALLRRLPACTIEEAEIDGPAKDGGWRRHFTWARNPRGAVSVLVDWLQRRAGNHHWAARSNPA